MRLLRTVGWGVVWIVGECAIYFAFFLIAAGLFAAYAGVYGDAAKFLGGGALTFALSLMVGSRMTKDGDE